jgi:hypothetical protein
MTAPSLRSLQRLLAADVLRRAAGEESGDGDLMAIVLVPPGVDARDRIAVYRDGYPARVLEALREAYPAIANICGEGSFANLTRRYLRDRDVSRSSLNDVGRQLPDHCAQDPLAIALPFLADLARLEWSVLQAFHSRDGAPVDPSAFATWDMSDWERAVFTFQPSVSIGRSPWPVCDLWESRRTPRGEIDIDLAARPQAVLVRRAGDDVDCVVPASLEVFVLESLIGGATLAAAMDDLSEVDAVAGDIGPMFSSWLAAGMITAVWLAD